MRKKSSLALALLALAAVAGCGDQASVWNSLTTPSLQLGFAETPVSGRAGTIALLQVTFDPGFADGSPQPLDFIDLTTDAQSDIFSFPRQLTLSDFVDGVAEVPVTLNFDLLQNREFTFSASGQDVLTRDIPPVSAILTVTAVSGRAVFAPAAGVSPPQDSVYLALAPADDPADGEVLLDVWFKGSAAGTCVRGINFHLVYDDQPSSGGTLFYLGRTAGTFPANAFIDPPDGKEDRPADKEIIVAANSFSCTTANDGAPQRVMTLRFQVDSGNPIPLAFSHGSVFVDDDIQTPLAGVSWLAGSADIQLP